MAQPVSETDAVRQIQCSGTAYFPRDPCVEHRHFDILFDRQMRKEVETLENKADLFISVHHNSAANTAASGHEVYFLRSENDAETALAIDSVQMAFQIEKSLFAHLPQTAVRGVKCARFKVLRLSSVPSILIEAGFVSNPDEVQILSSRDYQQLFAEAVASSF